MTDIIEYLLYGTIGAFIALMVKESFAWKGQGRIEAIKRYEKLLIDCYGELKPLISRLNRKNNCILLKESTHELIEDILVKFSFRIPEHLNEYLNQLLYESSIIEGDINKLEFKSKDEATNFWLNFLESIIQIMSDINQEIKKLESYTQSLSSRIWYTIFVWNFRNKNLID